jgi:hypothetical protein
MYLDVLLSPPSPIFQLTNRPVTLSVKHSSQLINKQTTLANGLEFIRPMLHVSPMLSSSTRLNKDYSTAPNSSTLKLSTPPSLPTTISNLSISPTLNSRLLHALQYRKSSKGRRQPEKEGSSIRSKHSLLAQSRNLPLTSTSLAPSRTLPTLKDSDSLGLAKKLQL